MKQDYEENKENGTDITKLITKILSNIRLSTIVYNQLNTIINCTIRLSISKTGRLKTTDKIIFYLLFHKKYPDKFKTEISINDQTKKVLKPDVGIYYIICNHNLCILNHYINSTMINPSGKINDDPDVYNFYIIGKSPYTFYNKLVKISDEKDNQLLRYNIKKRSVASMSRYSASRMGDTWLYYEEITKNLNKIVMDVNDKNDILDAIRRFQDERVLYSLKKNKINARLGILLYGKPGTGKSELARAISLEVRIPIRIITAELIANPMVYDIIRKDENISPRIYLIEEIDGLLNDESDNKANIILRRDQVLSFIDSLPSNCILIATTNYLDRLDSALIRPGRFDIKKEMKLFNRTDAEKLISNICDYDFSYMLDMYEYPIQPSKIQSDINIEYSKMLFKSFND